MECDSIAKFIVEYYDKNSKLPPYKIEMDKIIINEEFTIPSYIYDILLMSGRLSSSYKNNLANIQITSDKGYIDISTGRIKPTGCGGTLLVLTNNIEFKEGDNDRVIYVMMRQQNRKFLVLSKKIFGILGYAMPKCFEEYIDFDVREILRHFLSKASPLRAGMQ